MAQTYLAQSRDAERADPYWLYAASNAGSLLGLLAYPLLIEPLSGIRSQRLWWSAFYVGYLVLAALVAPRAGGTPAGVAAAANDADDAAPAGAPSDVSRTGPKSVALWLVLSAAPSMMLMAVTNAISFDVGSVPLVWVAPLALYLSTFILVFGKTRLYPQLLRDYWLEAAVMGLVVLVAAPMFPSWPRMALHLLALFAVATAAHAELHRLRPPTHELTRYYLVISVGGWLGGLFVSLAAPELFSRLLEYPIAILIVAAALAYSRRGVEHVTEAQLRLGIAVHTPAVVAGLAFSAVWMLPSMGPTTTRMLLLRNHYGIYQVGELPHDVSVDGEERTVKVRQIVHNGTMHGAQVIDDDLRYEPIAYYHRSGGFGTAIRTLAHPFKLGVVGLGAGASAAYVRPEDEIVYYEIDPDDEVIAREWFTYLGDCPGRSRVVIGDARVELATDPEAPDGYFDALLIDAFSGDAIPTHLLTREAIELYRRKLRPGGLLLFNITNRFYDLRPVLASAANALGMSAASMTREVADGLKPLENRTRFWVMTDDPAAMKRVVEAGFTPIEEAEPPIAPTRTWTDDYVNVLAPLWAHAWEH
jgi:spermidine synthase